MKHPRLTSVLPLVFSCLCLLVLTGRPLPCWASTADDAYNQLAPLIAQNPARTQINDLYTIDLLMTMSQVASDSHAEDILRLQWAIVANPLNDAQVREMALLGMHWQNRDSVLTFVRGYLTDATLKIGAATVLATWEQWTDCLTILTTAEHNGPHWSNTMLLMLKPFCWVR